MNGKTRIFLFLVIIISLLAIKIETAYACSCAIPGPPAEELTRSIAVFTGKVIRISKPPNIGSLSSADPVKVTFQVYEVWKGAVSETTTIITSRSGASCGYAFEKGGEYIVYAHGSEDSFSVSLCSRTKSLDRAEEDLEVLGVGAGPAADNTVGPMIFPHVQGPAILDIGMGIIILGLVVAAIIKRSSRD